MAEIRINGLYVFSKCSRYEISPPPCFISPISCPALKTLFAPVITTHLTCGSFSAAVRAFCNSVVISKLKALARWVGEGLSPWNGRSNAWMVAMAPSSFSKTLKSSPVRPKPWKAMIGNAPMPEVRNDSSSELCENEAITLG